MPKVPFFFRNLLNRLALNKTQHLVFLILIALCLIYVMKTCSRSSKIKTIYRIGQDVQWEGLPLMGREKNMTAFSGELLKKMAENEHLKIQLFSYVPYELFKRLENGSLDAILSTIQPDFINQTRFAFSDPYFLFGPLLILPRSS